MKIVAVMLIASALFLTGCSTTPQPAQQPQQPQLSEEAKAANRAKGFVENFVSVPELQDVMNAMIMEQADLLWSVTGPEDAPKDVDGWLKLEHAAIAMAETMKFVQTSHLAKDQGEWKNRSEALIEAANQARAAIKSRNADKLLEVGGNIESSCSGCHKIYYTEG
jgi:hypothetical protein